MDNCANLREIKVSVNVLLPRFGKVIKRQHDRLATGRRYMFRNERKTDTDMSFRSLLIAYVVEHTKRFYAFMKFQRF